MFGKDWWQSKTFWVGTMEVVISILALLAGDQLISQNPRTVAVLGIVVGILTIVLRKITAEPIKPLRG